MKNTSKSDLDLKVYNSSKSLLNDLLRLRREKSLVFRGMSRKKEYEPTILRYYTKEGTQNLAKYEYQMLYDFYRRWNQRKFESSESILELVASAQHYGIPTRLVDWTRDPYVALFFSISNNPKPDDGYYTLIYTDLTEHTVIDNLFLPTTWDDMERTPYIIYNYKRFLSTIYNQKFLQELIEARNNDLKMMNVQSTSHFRKNGLIFYDAPFSNDRILAQKGLFSIPTSIEGINASEQILAQTKEIRIELSLKDRDELLEYLENMNYSTNYLFPDLQNICRYIVDKTIQQDYKSKTEN